MNKSTRSIEQAPAAGLGAVANSDLKGRAGSAVAQAGAASTAAAKPATAAKPVAASSFETVAGDMPAGADHVRSGRAARATDRMVDGKKQKICCHCGKDVAREERFKDKSGYYWCMDCGVQENREKHAIGHAQAAAAAAAAAITCPDCARPVPAAEVVEYERVKLCNTCADKRQKQAAREASRAAARKAAIEEAAIEEARHRRHMLIGAAVAAVLAVAGAAYMMAS